MNTTTKKIMELLKEKDAGAEQSSFNLELLLGLNAIFEDLEEYQANDKESDGYMNEETKEFKEAIHNAMLERLDELCKAEKEVKKIIEEDDEFDIALEDEARELVELMHEDYNGKVIAWNVLDIANKLEKDIWERKTFETNIAVIKTIKDCIKKGIVTEDITNSNAIFANYIAINSVLQAINEKDWMDIEDMKMLDEEDTEVEKFIAEYVNECLQEGLDINKEDLKFLSQCGLDNIYVRSFIDNEDFYVCLFDENENRLTDCKMLY